MKTKLNTKITLILLLSITVFLLSCEKMDPETPIGYNNRIDIVIDSVTDIVFDKARVFYEVVDIKNHKIETFGFCWDTLEYPTINNNFIKYEELLTAGNSEIMLSNLFFGKNHYLRMFAISGEIIAYSNQINFNTGYGIPIPPDIIETGSVFNITNSTATAGAYIIDLGISVNFVEHGHCWCDNSVPDINSSNITQLGPVNEPGKFFSNLENLSSNTTYYIRAYAKTSYGGVAYGETISFKTD